MTIPDAAIEAAAESDYYFGKDTRYGMVLWQGLNSESRNLYRKQALAAIEAAMPAIREALAQEVEAWIKSPLTEQERWENAGGRAAARIVRGGDA